MALSRRRIFKLGGGMLLAASAIPASGAGAELLLNSRDTLYSKDVFQPLVNSGFKVESQDTWLTLLSVESTEPTPTSLQPARAAAVAPQTETMLLSFSVSGDALAQGTYQLNHSKIGSFPLFVVPSGTTTYAATINRLLTPDVAPVAPTRRRR